MSQIFIWLYMEGLYYSKSWHFSVFGKILNFHKFGKILQNCWNYRIGVSSLMNFNNSMKNNISMIRSSKYYICNCEQRNQKCFFGDFRLHYWSKLLKFINRSEKSRNKDPWNKPSIKWQISIFTKIEKYKTHSYKTFSNFTLPRNEERTWKESLMGTCRLTSSLYARLMLPVMFLLQAFMIT